MRGKILLKVFSIVYAVVMMVLFHLPEMIYYVLKIVHLKMLQAIAFILKKIVDCIEYENK